MKTYKYLSKLMVVAIGAVAFTSCSSDDDEISGSNNTGNQTQFSYNGHECVDLGLPSGVKWATTNIGASSATDYGYYISWGETSPNSKNYYAESTNKYYSSANVPLPTKYTVSDKKLKLESSDDAAYRNWGGSWRMPAVADVKELLDNTKTTCETINGVKVLRFTSKNNGASIIIPFGGYKSYSSLEKNGSGFYVATSELSYNYTSSSFYKKNTYCECFKGTSSQASHSALSRYCGSNIRPVYGQPKAGTQDSSSGNNTSEGSSSSGSTSSSSKEKPEVYLMDYTEYRASGKICVRYRVISDTKVTSVKIYGGSSTNPSSSMSTTFAGSLATAYYSGMKSDNYYYFKCVATNAAGTTTSDVTKYYYYK